MPNNNNYLDNSGVEYLWSKIKNYQKNNRYIYAVKGTQTSATKLWTGTIEINALYDGLTIAYYLPYAGDTSGATLNLTLSNGTRTGAIEVYLTGTTRITNQYGAGSTILLTYWSKGSISVSGTATTQNRWLRADYDANTITTATTTGNGNAVTSISASNGALTITKGSTFLTSHPTITTTTDTTSTASPSHGGTFTTIDSVTRDTNGHVTKVNTKTITLPSDNNTDTKVNVTLGTTTKAYILGTSTTPTSTASGVTSISDTGVYLDTTAGRLRATTYGITNGNYVNILSSSTLSANATQTFPSTGGTLLNTGTTSYTQTVTSSATNAYEIGKIKINGTETTIYGKYTDTNTDTKVTQSNATGNTNRPLLLSHDSITTTGDVTDVVYRNAAIYANPSTGTITSNAYTAYNGDIIIRKETSIADDLPAMLQFRNYQTDNNILTSGAFIRVYDDHDTSSSGSNMLIQSGGNVVIGGGEAPNTIYSSLITSTYPSHEHLFLTSDNGIKIVLTDSSDVTDVSKYKTFELNNSGNFYQTTSEAYDNDGFGAVGVKSRRFYEGNFHHINVTTGVHYHKSYSNGTEDTFPLIYFNTSNIWIGSTGTAGAQHKGTLNLSAGFDTTNNVPYESATVAVANSDNTAATPYHILHKGNTSHILTSSDDAWSSVGVPLTSGYIFKVLRVGKGSSAPTPPTWAGSKYDNGLVVGCEDGKMLITAGMDNPRVTFAGGHNSSTVTKPEWYFKLTGTSGTTYNLDTHHPTIEMESDTGGTANLNHNGTFTTGTVERDDNGHVIAVNAKTYTLIANKVTQKNTTSNTAYRLLLSYAANDTEVVNTTFKNSSLTFNPSTSVLTAGNTVKLHAENAVATVTSADINISAEIINDGVPVIDITNSSTSSHAGVKASSFYGELDGTISSDTTATTQSISDNSTKVATTEFVKDAIDDSRIIHTATGTGNQAGWVKIATIKHIGTYNNTPIMLTIAQRASIQIYRVTISFTSVNSTDPELSSFTLTTDGAWTGSNARAYIIKSATSTWDLYIYKLTNYDSISVTEFDISAYTSTRTNWTWTDVQTAASAITGGTEATKKTLVTTENLDNFPSFYVMYNNSSGTSTSVTTSSAYTQTFAYFKVFIYNTAQSTTHVVDINGSAGYNQICIGWGMSPSSTTYYRTTNASILTSVSSNKYTFALTIGYTIQASSTGNATATTNPTLYIRKIIGFVC